MYVLRTLYEVREIAENRIRKYNEERQHDSLDDLTPLEYLATRNLQENSNYACD
jgi:putative transposase